MCDNRLIHARIIRFERVHDYYTLKTSAGIISIFNPVSFRRDGALCDINVQDLTGHYIIGEEYVPEEYYEITLDNRCKMRISLVAEDYYTPEAICIHFNTGEIVVFN